MKTAPRLQAIVTQIAQKQGLDLDQPGAYVRLELAGNGQLVIENIGANRVSVTNYITANQDLIADPQVVLCMQYHSEGKQAKQPRPKGSPGWVPLEITELFGGWRLYAEVDLQGHLVLYDAAGQARLAELCEHIFARNLRRFGWLHRAQRAASAPRPWSDEEINARDMRSEDMAGFDEGVTHDQA